MCRAPEGLWRDEKPRDQCVAGACRAFCLTNVQGPCVFSRRLQGLWQVEKPLPNECVGLLRFEQELAGTLANRKAFTKRMCRAPAI